MKLSKGGGQFIDDTSTQQWRLMMNIKRGKEKLSAEKALDLPSNLNTKTTSDKTNKQDSQFHHWSLTPPNIAEMFS